MTQTPTPRKPSYLRFLIPLILFGALAGLLFYGLGQDPREVPSPLVGKPAPEFDLPEMLNESRRVSNADLDGQISLVNVWASWCNACRAEHGMLMELSRRDDFQIVGFNWKDAEGNGAQVIRMTGNPYDMIAFDPDNRSGIDWGVYGAPETFIVDREGMIRYKHIGPITPQAWQETLEPIINDIKREQPGGRS